MSKFAVLKALPLIAWIALGIIPAEAQTTDEHHDENTPQTLPAPAPGMGSMMPMMQMMQMMQSSQMMQMAQMMQMMQAMQTMQSGRAGGMTAPGMAPMAGMSVMPSQNTEALIAGYKQALAITDAQLPQWNAFADSVRSGAKQIRAAVPAAGTNAALFAPEQLKSKAAVLTAELAAINQTQPATAALYAVLSEQQKRVADRLMAEHLAGM